MPEIRSKRQQMDDAAVSHAEDALVRTFQAQGVGAYEARRFVEEHVTFRLAHDGRVLPDAGNLAARGSTDEHLAWFARELHIAHPELGGTPVPFRGEQPPQSEGQQRDAEQLEQARTAASDASKDRATREQHDRDAARGRDIERSVGGHRTSLNNPF